MDLKTLEVFCRIVELKSFTRAAEAVSLTQPTVSGHIKDLEDELGLRLLDRAGRAVTPTRAGAILHTYAQRILGLRAEAQQAIREHKGGLTGDLALGASSIPGAYLLPPLIALFKRDHPDAAIALAIQGSREMEKALTEHGVDCNRLRVVLEVTGNEAVRQAMKAGAGVAVISRRAVEDDIRCGLVAAIRFRDARLVRAVFLVTHRTRSRSPLGTAFVAFLRASARSATDGKGARTPWPR